MPHTNDVLLLAAVARDVVVHALATLAAVLDEAEMEELLLRVDGEECVRGGVRLPGFRRGHASVAPIKVLEVGLPISKFCQLMLC